MIQKKETTIQSKKHDVHPTQRTAVQQKRPMTHPMKPAMQQRKSTKLREKFL